MSLHGMDDYNDGCEHLQFLRDPCHGSSAVGCALSELLHACLRDASTRGKRFILLAAFSFVKNCARAFANL